MLMRRLVARRDSGVAMVMVLGIMMVGIVIVATLATVTVFNAERTLTSRVEQRALTSADSAIDLVHDMIAGLKYKDLAGVCNLPDVIINDDDVDITLTYSVVRGTTVEEVACPTASDITLLLTVESTATTAPIALNGEPVTRTVVSTFTPTLPEGTLDRALFSETTMTLNNNTEIHESAAGLKDGHVYSNGGITCSTNEIIEGSVVAAHGDVNLINTCDVFSDVWASGNVVISASGANIYGNIYAAATTQPYSVRIMNSGAGVTGSVLTNGGIFIQNSKTTNNGGIGGAAYSSAGVIYLDQQSEIKGAAYAKRGINVGQQSEIGIDAISQGVSGDSTTGNITTSGAQAKVGGHAYAMGTISNSLGLPNPRASYEHPGAARAFPAILQVPTGVSPVIPDAVGYPGTIVVPPREQMEMITMDADDRAKWELQGWTIVDASAYCYNPTWIVNNANGTAGPRMLDFSACPQKLYFDNATLVLTSDVAMVSPKGFSSSNDLRVSSADGIEKFLYWIVPADSPGVTWGTTATSSGQLSPTCVAPAGDIYISKFQSISNVAQLIYTPCTFSSQNPIPTSGGVFKGQIYAGHVAQTNGWTQQMHTMPVPSIAVADPSPDDDVDFRLSSRFDVKG